MSIEEDVADPSFTRPEEDADDIRFLILSENLRLHRAHFLVRRTLLISASQSQSTAASTAARPVSLPMSLRIEAKTPGGQSATRADCP